MIWASWASCNNIHRSLKLGTLSKSMNLSILNQDQKICSNQIEYIFSIRNIQIKNYSFSIMVKSYQIVCSIQFATPSCQRLLGSVTIICLSAKINTCLFLRHWSIVLSSSWIQNGTKSVGPSRTHFTLVN